MVVTEVLSEGLFVNVDCTLLFTVHTFSYWFSFCAFGEIFDYWKTGIGWSLGTGGIRGVGDNLFFLPDGIVNKNLICCIQKLFVHLINLAIAKIDAHAASIHQVS